MLEVRESDIEESILDAKKLYKNNRRHAGLFFIQVFVIILRRRRFGVGNRLSSWSLTKSPPFVSLHWLKITIPVKAKRIPSCVQIQN